MTPDGLVDAVCRSIRDETGDLDDLVDRAVRELAPLTTAEQRQQLRIDATAQMRGLGELDRLVGDADIDEVLVNGDQIWVDRAGRIEAMGVLHGATVEQMIERILAPIGRRVDRTTPIVDARLSNGARVCAVVPPVAIGGASLSIRRFSDDVRSLADFTGITGTALIREVVADRLNVVVCGATSSGKTSLLAAMLDEVDNAERLIILEDTTELPCRAPHVVRLEARPATAEGMRSVTLTDLVRTALRLRPDRLVVGEVRSDECLALIQAMNTGHDGSFSTCHANGPLDALLRLESLVLQAAPQWPLSAVRQQLARSIDVIVHVGRSGCTRQILEVCEVDPPPLDGALTAPSVRPLARSTGGDLAIEASLDRRRR